MPDDLRRIGERRLVTRGGTLEDAVVPMPALSLLFAVMLAIVELPTKLRLD